MDQQTARAHVEAGYMTHAEYLRLCTQNGWTVALPAPPVPKAPAEEEAAA